MLNVMVMTMLVAATIGNYWADADGIHVVLTFLVVIMLIVMAMGMLSVTTVAMRWLMQPLKLGC